ncbi:BamA/TamA family outer membrane protein, partial [Candidatus Aerophobetes bacterium]|nr:BamA/TamA family outer membrane protein [Candidatus Aerophobetes bacterium]
VFDSSLNPTPWEGTINAVGANIGYFSLNPVREPEMMPWGNKLVAGAEWADQQIGSELEYTGLSLSLRNYFRVSKDLNLALQIEGKTIKNKDPQKRLVYTLDGWTELRGYPQDFLDSFSGENLVFASVESRINLKRQVGGSSSFYFDNMGLAFFYDAGATWPCNENLKKDDIHQDAGVELRIRFLPFGKYSALLRFGVSFPLDFDRKGKFFLMLGGVF